MLKNKIQLSRVGDLIGFIKQFMNQAASHPATGKVLPGVLTLDGFYRKRGGARELVTKEKKGLFLDQDVLFGGKRTASALIMQIASSF